MLTVEEWMDVQALHRQGLSVRQIARLTGRSRNTVSRILDQVAPRPYSRPPGPSKLDPFKDYLAQRYQECPLSAVRLLAEIQPMGYTGSIDLVRRYLLTLKQDRALQAKATVRFETPPGHQAQMDWAFCGRFVTPSGEPLSVYAFVMVLCFSRMLYLEFTQDMGLPTLLAAHLRAFAFFGGWPRELLYDNMKQVRLFAGPAGEWNPLFLDFAGHYGITPRVCRVRRPRTKGKVERSIRYVRGNFLAGRSFVDLPDLNAQALHWLSATANVRVHATTGRRPVELLPQENLTPLGSIAPYPVRNRTMREVDAEGYVHYDRSRYSAPPEHVGAVVVVEEGDQRIRLRLKDLIIADHPRAPRPGSCMVLKEHVEALWRLSVLSGGAPPPEAPPWRLTFDAGVASRPLAAYEEFASQPAREALGPEVTR